MRGGDAAPSSLCRYGDHDQRMRPQLKMQYVPLLRLGAITPYDTSIVDLCNDYDPVTSFVLSLCFTLEAGLTHYRLSPQYPSLLPEAAAQQCPSPPSVLMI